MIWHTANDTLSIYCIRCVCGCTCRKYLHSYCACILCVLLLLKASDDTVLALNGAGASPVLQRDTQ